ncbi:MAG: 4Fe-4S dicluster domain-containing protein [Ruminococcaceae bacterium]|nr:4Fe-4S dicluster domain-containing protein [Oscillospiraceae bacterium]
MIYKAFQGEQLSALGLGAMRLPTGADGCIDEGKSAEMVAYAMEKGINYYDTAWGYHNGESEPMMGKLLSAYPRESFNLASKFPGYDLANMGKVEEIFEKQLERCRVSYFDFYLFHNVCELNIDAYLDPQNGIYDYLIKQRDAGRIRHLGFSAHANLDTMRRFLEAYGKDMEFGQLQVNYLDWNFQEAKEKIALLDEYGIPVWVMEPIRGGKLATVSGEHAKALAKIRPEESLVALAFRFLQSIPQVTVTLSGMSNLQQLAENIATYEADKPLNGIEFEQVLTVAADMLKNMVPCTSCRYCTEYCPQGLDIPRLIKLYNEHAFTGGGFIAPMALRKIDEEKQPGACLGCQSCEAVCPQQIKIAEVMADFASRLK